ncbi:ABC transporter ATP-binding protein [Tengunoibacter tsumagoiensis]|uniref:Putative ABC transporter ATP-binding protein YhaQ n=1 Tax=Tengunoibacter tsumagoiensis TaxID=2014871 RepID=A0A402A6V5_9CHLR|nr:ATP-binding cassette domain-containing protein [Tengunoibacter tsumagoiensis]GCE14877.1 putative ABC transporter ATP-binding protein YhaQ [Tengunoibacter tsumagoiensis]
MGLIVEHISKSFAQFQAIKDLSMEVKEGTIFGFLGANGAGKTTTMRMILDIFRPDTGQITWNGRPVHEVPRREWGYLPEERGLYPKMTVEEQLLFLARLNGLSKQAAKTTLDEWLERFQINANRKKRVEELSKGNQQKVQFLAAVLHNPNILIMDEPFSGLDPVNANVLKEAFLEMHRRGKTIIFSTHQLEQVEEMCEDIVIINKGEIVTHGSVQDVKRQHGRNIVRLKLENDPEALWLDTLAGVHVTKRRQDYIEMDIQANLNPNAIVEAALRHNGIIVRFELVAPSLTDIFIETVGKIALPDAVSTVSA